jgi:hypothetical protein
LGLSPSLSPLRGCAARCIENESQQTLYRVDPQQSV